MVLSVMIIPIYCSDLILNMVITGIRLVLNVLFRHGCRIEVTDFLLWKTHERWSFQTLLEEPPKTVVMGEMLAYIVFMYSEYFWILFEIGIFKSMLESKQGVVRSSDNDTRLWHVVLVILDSVSGS